VSRSQVGLCISSAVIFTLTWTTLSFLTVLTPLFCFGWDTSLCFFCVFGCFFWVLVVSFGFLVFFVFGFWVRIKKKPYFELCFCCLLGVWLKILSCFLFCVFVCCQFGIERAEDFNAIQDHIASSFPWWITCQRIYQCQTDNTQKHKTKNKTRFWAKLPTKQQKQSSKNSFFVIRTQNPNTKNTKNPKETTQNPKETAKNTKETTRRISSKKTKEKSQNSKEAECCSG